MKMVLPIQPDKPVIMGILNVTPDSFSDGGQHFDGARALERALKMVEEGAGIIDIGGESTRPGAQAVSLDEERRRVLPLLEALSGKITVPLSVDTSKPELMREAVAAGAGMINDVCALRQPGALEAMASCDVPICLMHMQGEPRTMQAAPHYTDVVSEVRDFLAGRIAACEQGGIKRERLILDPGFGFGKTLPHNLSLLKHLPELAALQRPILVGMSRKRMIADVTGAPVEERLGGSLALACVAAIRGAAIIRVHDVRETAQAVAMLAALEAAP